MTDEERMDILTAFVNAMLERNGGVLILSMKELEAAWGQTFTYNLTGDDIIFSFAKEG